MPPFFLHQFFFKFANCILQIFWETLIFFFPCSPVLPCGVRCAAQPCRPPEVIPPSCLPASLTCARLAGRSLGPGAPPAALGAMSIETLLEAARFLEWQAQQQQRARGERPGWAPGAPGKGRRATPVPEPTLKPRGQDPRPGGRRSLAALGSAQEQPPGEECCG